MTGLSNPNYAIASSGNTPGTLTIDPLTVAYSVANASSIFGMSPILGPATLFGVLPGDLVVPTVGAFRGLAPVALTPFTPVGQYAELVTALSNPDYRIAPAPNFPGVLTVSAPTANPGAPSDPGFLPGLTQINNPAPSEYDVGGFEQVLPRFTPSLPDPNRYSDPDPALRAISQSLENYFKHCQNPTQTTIADALENTPPSCKSWRRGCRRRCATFRRSSRKVPAGSAQPARGPRLSLCCARPPRPFTRRSPSSFRRTRKRAVASFATATWSRAPSTKHPSPW